MICFPKDFLWGATLSAHQVEGANYGNDWWRWEQRPGRIRDGANSQVAAGHFARFEDDFDLARKLGLRAVLFSIEWSRVQPNPDAVFDEEVIGHYAAVLDALLARYLEPVCVLHHVTVPAWFAQRGGWRHARAPESFERYVARMAAVFGEKCRWWLPFYETVHTVRMGYVEGRWPPGGHAPLAALRALAHLEEAHVLAYDAIHAQRPDAMVGVAVRGRACRPLDGDRSWDVRAAKAQNAFAHAFQDRLAGRFWPWQRRTGAGLEGLVDFLGLAYYGSETVRFNPLRPRRLFTQYTDAAGRPVDVGSVTTDPDGFHRVLQDVACYGLPILVTGNGLATENDLERCRYLLDHLAVVHRCLEEGLDIRGYFHRAFLDGFEWTQGYTARYGLVHIDRETLARTPNPSAYLYKDICETGTFRRGTLAQFCPEWGREHKATAP